MATDPTIEVTLGVQSFKRIAWKVWEVVFFTQVGDKRRLWTYRLEGKREQVQSEIHRKLAEAGWR